MRWSPTGASHLATILGRTRTPGLWSIFLDGAVQTTRPCSLTATPQACVIVEPADFISPGGNVSKNLTVNVNGGQLVLSGSIVVNPITASPEVSEVSTRVGYCQSSVAPASCTASTTALDSADFSSKTITPIAVQAGQIVQVTVTFTFS